jgi:hypothetical protein
LSLQQLEQLEIDYQSATRRMKRRGRHSYGPVNDPIRHLVRALRTEGRPSLAWTLEWTHRAPRGVDLVRAAWLESRSVHYMLALLAPQQRRAVERELDGRDDVATIRRLAVPPTMDALLAARRP